MANRKDFIAMLSLSYFLYCVHSCFSFHIIDYQEVNMNVNSVGIRYEFQRTLMFDLNIFKESKKIFDAFGISNPTDTDKKLAREIINERAKTAKEKYDHNRTRIELERELERERADAFKYKGELNATLVEKVQPNGFRFTKFSYLVAYFSFGFFRHFLLFCQTAV